MSNEAKRRVSNYIAKALGHANAMGDYSIRLGLLLRPGQDTPTKIVAYDVASKTEFFVDITLTERALPQIRKQQPVYPEQDLEVEIPPTAGRGGW